MRSMSLRWSRNNLLVYQRQGSEWAYQLRMLQYGFPPVILHITGREGLQRDGNKAHSSMVKKVFTPVDAWKIIRKS